MPIFKWQCLSKKEYPDKTGPYLVYHKNENIELSVFDVSDNQWRLHGDKSSPITHWTDYKKLGKPFSSPEF